MRETLKCGENEEEKEDKRKGKKNVINMKEQIPSGSANRR
jgi:hypothetical protein